MTDLSRFTPGEVIAVTDKWGDYTFEAPAVFLGVDRGLAVVAWPTGPVNNPFLIDHGERPYLRRATWEPRRIRKARVTGTYAEYEARLAAERAEKARKKARGRRPRRPQEGGVAVPVRGARPLPRGVQLHLRFGRRGQDLRRPGRHRGRRRRHRQSGRGGGWRHDRAARHHRAGRRLVPTSATSST
jgi:hypothetical protein